MCLIYVAVYVFQFAVLNIIYDALNLNTSETDDTNDNSPQTERRIYVAFAVAIFTFIWSLLFPYFLLPSLRADTQFWRGVGTSRGISTENNGRSNQGSSSTINECSNPVDMSIAANELQSMMVQLGRNLIDFAYLKKGRLLGRGASARVFEGSYKKNKVAIKVCSPTELSNEVIEAFITETKIMVDLDHINVVKFFGICLKPPDIALIIELCPLGDLKSNMQRDVAYWTPQRKLRASLECVRGLAYLHANNIIHRDVKTHNFFLADDHTVKLGDFGESTLAKARESMTILGTVGYMCPELIEGQKDYTSAIDVYAIGITLCEIWTGEEPFANVKNFLKIYGMVKNGERPTLPEAAPEGLNGVIKVSGLKSICLLSVYYFLPIFPNFRMLGLRTLWIDRHLPSYLIDCN
jgi:tRNA A-37 threonylcarbamoyl transferase component Bud32